MASPLAISLNRYIKRLRELSVTFNFPLPCPAMPNHELKTTVVSVSMFARHCALVAQLLVESPVIWTFHFKGTRVLQTMTAKFAANELTIAWAAVTFQAAPDSHCKHLQ